MKRYITQGLVIGIIFLSICGFRLNSNYFSGTITCTYQSTDANGTVTWAINGEALCLDYNLQYNEGQKYNYKVLVRPTAGEGHIIQPPLNGQTDGTSNVMNYKPRTLSPSEWEAEKSKYKAHFTGQTQTIAGYECQEYLLTHSEGQIQAWLAKDVAFNYRTYAPYLRDAAFFPVATQLPQGFPFMLKATDKTGKITHAHSVTKVDPQVPAAQLFHLPVVKH